MKTIHVTDAKTRSAALAAVAMTEAPFVVEIDGQGQSFQEWLDEIEVYSTRLERMIEDTQADGTPAVLRWLEAAYKEGARNA